MLFKKRFLQLLREDRIEGALVSSVGTEDGSLDRMSECRQRKVNALRICLVDGVSCVERKKEESRMILWFWSEQ